MNIGSTSTNLIGCEHLAGPIDRKRRYRELHREHTAAVKRKWTARNREKRAANAVRELRKGADAARAEADSPRAYLNEALNNDTRSTK